MMTTDISEIRTDSAEFGQALRMIEKTRRSIFLTGKAGTGKSTFLRYVCATTKKKHIVLAPTGIAAINAGGTTLHSFFKIPFHPLLPNDSRYTPRHIKETLKYNSEKCKIIREVELIIIDEISMVRADIIDFVDKVLRIYSRNMRQPFGGKQLLLVGDIFQLEPVLKEDDRQMLRPFYRSAYFFDAHVFRSMPLVSIELQKVFRQTDPVFIGILDRIRTSTADTTDLALLNSRVGTTTATGNGNLAITLSTRRDTVDHINEGELSRLPGSPTLFTGTIKGEFPESSLPTPVLLETKPGAQVIFIKNDIDKRWVNGTLGIIEAIDEEAGILYIVTEDGRELEVERNTWSNVRYTFNEKEQKIEEEEIGIYTQFPIRLAWAITVHKSQGLTFRQVNIDFTGGVFAGGQAYVALSRCTSLKGISLTTPVKMSDIFVRPEVTLFAQGYNNAGIINSAMRESGADKEYRMAAEAFDRGNMEAFIDNFFKAIHSRYDIEKPAPRRLIRRKLNIINCLREENRCLREELHRREKYLHKLAAEYTLLGKECEHEHMDSAAMANYRKALELYPDAIEPRKRLQRLENKNVK